jgi:hypothetical protein
MATPETVEDDAVVQEGMRAIQYLQSLAGIEESDEDARKGWALLTEREKEFTVELYKSLQPK